MGYFLIMIIFMVVAIIRAKNGKPWIWYGIGVGLQFISILGLQSRYNAFGLGDAMTSTWVVFILIAIISLILIVLRKNNS